MSHRTRALLGNRPCRSIYIGGILASRETIAIRTVLGSCISVCLYDAESRVGGMNHFMLPHCILGGSSNARYGVHSMELLINACMKEGGDRRRFQAKVFGGGHVLKMAESEDNVPKSNIRFIQQFLADEAIPVIAHDLGGYSAREVVFFPDTGRTFLKRLSQTGKPGSSAMQKLYRKEQDTLRVLTQSVEADDSNVTLF